ncbi:hypothetical protein SeMB42_g07548 [Synchytrium endobioticum]|uniref:Uncharacterized protein n=1 Tax=Synchytrium endobioticum TaxID=286115 RepID=A0A507C5Y2_9FUNG|nr:hypothetical protein SeMB42_g07548 [Synchytrium endobioticum]
MVSTINTAALANPIVREATPAETSAFSRILLPRNVVPRLLRMLQNNIQPNSHDCRVYIQTIGISIMMQRQE